MKNNCRKLQPIRHTSDDRMLVDALRNGHVDAAATLYDRYAVHVRKVIVRIMGMDQDLPDLINEVFYQAFKAINTIEDGSRLQAWITRVAIHVVRGCIRKRQRRNWLLFSPEREPQTAGIEAGASDESLEMVRWVRDVLGRMPADEQIVFTLRYFEEMKIIELAEACGISRSSAKRRLIKSERRFKKIAEKYPALNKRLDLSAKWRRR